MFAALKGHLLVVQYLVEERNADVTVRANVRTLTTFYFITNSYITQSGESLVYTAAFHGHVDIVKYLAEEGANVHHPTQVINSSH